MKRVYHPKKCLCTQYISFFSRKISALFHHSVRAIHKYILHCGNITPDGNFVNLSLPDAPMTYLLNHNSQWKFPNPMNNDNFNHSNAQQYLLSANSQVLSKLHRLLSRFFSRKVRIDKVLRGRKESVSGVNHLTLSSCNRSGRRYTCICNA